MHQLSSITEGSNPPKILAHDAKGNITKDYEDRTLKWDVDNHLREYSFTGSGASGGAKGLKAVSTTIKYRYTYDALGRRITRQNMNEIGPLGVSPGTLYVYAGQQVVAEYHNNVLTQKYVYGSYIDEPIAVLSANSSGPETIEYYHRNNIYSVMFMTNENGKTTEQYAYDAYGDWLSNHCSVNSLIFLSFC